MVDKQTPYLGLAYNDDLDRNFRTRYNLAQDTLDTLVPHTSYLSFPDKRQAIFDDSIFAADEVNFETTPKQSRYLLLGNTFFYEIQIKNKVALSVPASNGNISNIAIGTFNSKFTRHSGGHIMGLNQAAAAYSYSSGNGASLCAYGGMSFGATIPAGTPFNFGGYFYLSA